MLPAKRLFLWHQANEAQKKEQADLLRMAEEEQHHLRRIESLEAKLANLPPAATADEEIARLLLEQEIWLAKKDQERFCEETAERRLALEQSMQERSFEIMQLEGELTEAALTLYHRLAERVANPVVEVRKDACMGCFLPLSLRNLSEWKRGKGLVICDECGRILV